ncbi:phage virion morphogenesis protein [Pseudomonas resinovorans]|uniref:Phage virion morphogenesis protein n=1 Tax=Metapseudomonas resinovorans TaxID=53412 RepID=A0ABT4Y4S7_METRE|nr:phage virion morphogenesis protein [Pseudomonas resinovorans]MDA8483595.1 phage virion morphogenesis protein [Pseudomonas resinovorans]
MAVTLSVQSNLPKLQPLFVKLKELGGHPQPLLKKIAYYGESSTRERFNSETAPDGQKWKESLRARLTGGKTLTQDGHLGDSITSTANDQKAEWGSNRIYAAIHQFGGVIKPKSATALRFQIPGLGWVTRQQVTLPARPYLGISDDDQENILDLVNQHISSLIRSAAPGGA